MTLTSTTSILASFATLKCLSDAKKYCNAYQILTEFISYIIETEQDKIDKCFTNIENILNKMFELKYN